MKKKWTRMRERGTYSTYTTYKTHSPNKWSHIITKLKMIAMQEMRHIAKCLCAFLFIAFHLAKQQQFFTENCARFSRVRFFLFLCILFSVQPSSETSHTPLFRLLLISPLFSVVSFFIFLSRCLCVPILLWFSLFPSDSYIKKAFSSITRHNELKAKKRQTAQQQQQKARLE